MVRPAPFVKRNRRNTMAVEPKNQKVKDFSLNFYRGERIVEGIHIKCTEYRSRRIKQYVSELVKEGVTVEVK